MMKSRVAAVAYEIISNHEALWSLEVATRFQGIAYHKVKRLISKRQPSPSPLSRTMTLAEEAPLLKPGEDDVSAESNSPGSSATIQSTDDSENSNPSSFSEADRAAESMFQAYLTTPEKSIRRSSLPRRRPSSAEISTDALSHCDYLSGCLYHERQVAQYSILARSDSLALAWYNLRAFESLPYRKHIRMRPFEDGIERSFRNEVFLEAWMQSIRKRDDEAERICEQLEWHGHRTKAEQVVAVPKEQAMQLKTDATDVMDAEDEADISQLEADAEQVCDPTGEGSELIREARELQIQLRDALKREAEESEAVEGVAGQYERPLATTVEEDDNGATRMEHTSSLLHSRIQDREFSLQASCMHGESSDEQSTSDKEGGESSGEKENNVSDEEPNLSDVHDTKSRSAKLIRLRQDTQRLQFDLRKERDSGQLREAVDTERTPRMLRGRFADSDARVRGSSGVEGHGTDAATERDEALEAFYQAQDLAESEMLMLEEEYALDEGYENF